MGSLAPLVTKKKTKKKTWRNEEQGNKRDDAGVQREGAERKITGHDDAFPEQLKSYYKRITQARISHHSQLILHDKNNPKFLFPTFDPKTNSNFNNPPIRMLSAKTLRSSSEGTVNDIRTTLLSHSKISFNIPGQPLLSKESLEGSALVDAKTLHGVFSRVSPTICILDSIPTSLLKNSL